MRLNLGCGLAQLPTQKGATHTRHLDSYLPLSAYTEEWVNIDNKPLDGVDMVCDVFSYPWWPEGGEPFPDNSVKEIWASHLVEHIPHDADLNGQSLDYPDLETHAESDGWFAWMYEAWRVLVPNGLLHLVIPWPMGRSGMADPTHRRYVHPGVFSYTGAPNPDAPFDYGITCHFELTQQPSYTFSAEWLTAKGLTSPADLTQAEMAGAFAGIDAIWEYAVHLEAIKDAA